MAHEVKVSSTLLGVSPTTYPAYSLPALVGATPAPVTNPGKGMDGGVTRTQRRKRHQLDWLSSGRNPPVTLTPPCQIECLPPRIGLEANRKRSLKQTVTQDEPTAPTCQLRAPTPSPVVVGPPLSACTDMMAPMRTAWQCSSTRHQLRDTNREHNDGVVKDSFRLERTGYISDTLGSATADGQMRGRS